MLTISSGRAIFDLHTGGFFRQSGGVAIEYYWCFEHDRVERADERCRATNRLGPYDTPEAARDWRDRVEARNDAWEEQDEEWEGD